MTPGDGELRYQARRQLKPRPAPPPAPAVAPPPAPLPAPLPDAATTRPRRSTASLEPAASTEEVGVPLMTRVATAADRAVLQALQRRSVPAAGECPPLLVDAHAPPLAFEQIDECQVILAERGEDVLGFAAIRPRGDGDCELQALFVELDRWRLAAGQLLVEHCADAARLQGARALHATGDPGAEPFHVGCGFELVGTASTPQGPAQLLRRPLVRA
jgi:N-acetylglutamate synthase-like GNAT family acetyltransferase